MDSESMKAVSFRSEILIWDPFFCFKKYKWIEAEWKLNSQNWFNFFAVDIPYVMLLRLNIFVDRNK